MSNSDEEKSKDQNQRHKLLSKKTKSKYSLEDILNLYCCRHNIKDNEIQDKIKTIYYEKPGDSTLIDYNRDNGDQFPLSHHIQPAHLKRNKQENEIKEEIKEESNEEINGEEITKCILCNWEFLKGMSLHEKNTHINLCMEGKGEENKKELISTYEEIENLRKQNQEGQNNNNANNEEIKDIKKEKEKNENKIDEEKRKEYENKKQNIGNFVVNNNVIKKEEKEKGQNEENKYDEYDDDEEENED